MDVPKETISEYILFAHAISGCDTTSRMIGVGKHLAFKKLLGDSEFRKHAEIFRSGPYTEHDQIIEAGEKEIVSLYNGGKMTVWKNLDASDLKKKCSGVQNRFRHRFSHQVLDQIHLYFYLYLSL